MSRTPAVAPAVELSGAARFIVRLVQVVVVVALLGYTASVLVRGPDRPSVLLDGWLTHVVLTGSVLLCLLRGLLVRTERWVWLSLGLGLGLWTAGNGYWWLELRLAEQPPYPSWADAGWLAFYPCAYVTLALLVRHRVLQLPVSVWLDGLIGGLSAAALSAALFLAPIIAATSGGTAAVATNLAYPVGDLLLLMLMIGVFAVLGWHPGPKWWLLGSGFVLFAVADTLFLFQIATDTYTVGTWLDVLWPAAMTLLGLAAWQPTHHGQVRRLEGWAVLLMPLLFTLLSLAVLFRATLTPTPLPASLLALSAVLVAVARTGLTFREVRALAESRRQARTDELTHLPNRRSVYEALTRADTRLAAGTPLAVMLIDLDRFKEINDSFGHTAGDALLREVAPRLKDQLRAGDLLARLGGDEFVVLAFDTTAQDALTLAARLRSALQQPFTFGAMTLRVDASIGIALGPEHSTTAEELLQLADLAMYSAKNRHVGAAVYEEDRDGHGRHRLETAEQLRAGIHRDELVLHYQPKLALASGTITGVEALVRWQHPQHGLLYPDAFIDLAESYGLMHPLTLHVLDLALTQCRTWTDTGHPLTVAVNVSPSNLVDDDFPDHVAARLNAHNLPPSTLVLEVTENLLMEDRQRTIRVLTRLRHLGVGVAIDDYGTGYSSLAYLAELPVTELKLDRAFTATMTDNPRNNAIVTSTLHLAHALGLTLVAEGAEDQPTVDALTSLGCDHLQGYHLSRPLPPEQLLTWLHHRQPPIPPQRHPNPPEPSSPSEPSNPSNPADPSGTRTTASTREG